MHSSPLRASVVGAAMLAAALSAPTAFAADRPATPEGAQKLRDLFGTLLPTAATSLIVVKAEGSDYIISFDLSALNGLLKAAGVEVAYDPATLVYKATEQDDGKWQVGSVSIPPVVSRSPEATSTVDITNFKQTFLIDPAIAWFLNGSASADKSVIKWQEKKSEETVDFGAFRADFTTDPGANGFLSSKGKEEIADIGIKISGFGEDNAPINVSGRIDKAKLDASVDGLNSQKAFQLWTLLASHGTRADLAQHEEELKDLLNALATPGLKVGEGIEAQRLNFTSVLGAIALAEFKYQFDAANAGPESSIGLSVSAEGLSLPAGLTPPGAADLTPSKLDVAASFKGIDIAAAAKEAIADMRLQSDGPPISDEDSRKVMAALLSAGAMRIELAPSHVRAPALDADLQGEIHYALGKPSGAATIRMRGFDKTMAAVKGLGPETAAKALPGLAMAKGLAKSESDGTLTWVVEMGEDRSIKVNGLPLGKAPD